MLNRDSARTALIVDRLDRDAGIQIENFTAQHFELAREAYARFGKAKMSQVSTMGTVFLTRWQRRPGCRCFSKGKFFQDGLAGVLPNT
jgi:uncharacterized protein with PIN domain